jgi:hypothetical protein
MENIHTFPGLAKGKRAPEPSRARLSFGDFLTTLPTVPLVDTAPDFVFPMDGNDSVGDCVVAGWDHFRQIVTGLLTGTQKNFTQNEIWAFYKTQNPNFDPNSSTHGAGSSSDNGMSIQLFLEYLVSQKLILGFASVDWKNLAERQAAIYIGLGLMSGVQLQNAQMQQFQNGTWDFVAGSPIDGGHCIPEAGYNGDETDIVSWGKVIKCTSAFVLNQMDECWFVLMQEHIDHPSFRNHFDLKGFADAVKAITNGKVIIPVPVLPTLKQGSKGPAVVTLQNKLNANGATPALVADGSFGAKTRTALMTFQSAHNLVPDGICGKMTWQAFDMIDVITKVCLAQGIEPLLGVMVASWESSLNPVAKLYNPPSKSTDRGLFQWNDVFHSEISDAQAFDPTIASTDFCLAVKAGNLVKFWSASMPNWKKHLTPAILSEYGIM